MGERNHEHNVLALIWSMAGLTWRMFAPAVMFVPAGIWADLHWSTKPWLTGVSTIVALCFSALLVKRQLKELE
jgi:hypothetical protein